MCAGETTGGPAGWFGGPGADFGLREMSAAFLPGQRVSGARVWHQDLLLAVVICGRVLDRNLHPRAISRPRGGWGAGPDAGQGKE